MSYLDGYNPIDHATTDTRSGDQGFCFFDDPEEDEDEEDLRSATPRKVYREGLTRLIYVLTCPEHPVAEILAQVIAPALELEPWECELQMEILAAVLGKTERKSLAAIGRRYGIDVRATISKRAQRCKKDPLVRALMKYTHVKPPEVSEVNSVRASRVHEENTQLEQQWQPTPQFSKFLQTLTT